MVYTPETQYVTQAMEAMEHTAEVRKPPLRSPLAHSTRTTKERHAGIVDRGCAISLVPRLTSRTLHAHVGEQHPKSAPCPKSPFAADRTRADQRATAVMVQL